MTANGTSPAPFDCMRCGACCASFRVSFYFAEAIANHLPDNRVEHLNERFSCMAGTNSVAPRCAALQGNVGESAACDVYAQRPSPCREVQSGDSQCLIARAKYGLPTA